MSLDLSGLSSKVKATTISIAVTTKHPLIQLANTLPLEELAAPVIEDLKNTTAKGFWNIGRKLSVRIHLMIFLLQNILNISDRKVIAGVKENAFYQAFCGVTILDRWFIPAPQKIEEFRNRLRPETKLMLVNSIASHAVRMGFADPRTLDMDSTIQEANMAYPSDANLMGKLGEKVAQVTEWVSKNTKKIMDPGSKIDISKLKSLVKGYFFQAKNTAKEIRQAAFQKLHAEAKSVVYQGLKILGKLDQRRIKNMPWNIKQAFDQIATQGKRYILDVKHFIRTGSIKTGKSLSFHLQEVACLTKGKLGKKHEFGREFQVGVLGGNFVISTICDRIRTNDKAAVPPMLQTHEELFGQGVLQSFAGDKGYYSERNQISLEERIEDFHLGYQYEDQTEEDYHRLYCRRSQVEGTIAHIKKGGQLGKSRMRSDTATLGAGYSSMLGFNLRQMMRKLERKK